MLVFNLPLTFRWLTNSHDSDFVIYYVAAVSGWHDGWAQMYNVDHPLPAGLEWAFYHYMLEPPPVAWLVGPLILLPYRAALLLWQLLMLGCAVAASLLLGNSAPQRAWLLLINLAFVPTAMVLGFGQVTVIVALAVVSGLLLLRSGRPELAGLVLAATVVKPHVAILVPLVLLLAGHWRAVAVYVLAAGTVTAVSLLQLGVSGFRLWVSALNYTYANRGGYLAYDTLIGTFGTPTGLLLTFAVVVLVASLGLLARGRDPGPAVAGSLVASLLITTYLLPYDMTLLFTAAALVWLAAAPRWLRLVMVADCLLIDFQNLANPFPIALFLELGFLACILVWQLRPRYPRDEPRPQRKNVYQM